MRDVPGNDIVQIERRIFPAPGVVTPVNDRPFPRALVVANEKNGAMIAAPRLIGGEMVEPKPVSGHVVWRQ